MEELGDFFSLVLIVCAFHRPAVAVAAVLLLSLLREPLVHVVEILLQSKPVPVSAAVLLLLLIICIFNISVSLFTFGALFLLKDALREVGERLPRRTRGGET